MRRSEHARGTSTMKTTTTNNNNSTEVFSEEATLKDLQTFLNHDNDNHSHEFPSPGLSRDGGFQLAKKAFAQATASAEVQMQCYLLRV